MRKLKGFSRSCDGKKVFDSGELEPKIGVVVGTRPGIVMFAPIIHALRAKNVPHFVIHTGQHYSPNMDDVFFRDLNLPTPDYRLEGVAECLTHGAQTATMLEGIEAILLKERPKLVLVGGDANTNLAGGLAARRLRIGVGHVEAGERSFDWRMPEEHNRRILDHISDLLFATDDRSVAHLRKESVQGAIHI
ncbi:UDP-N-acetylglucosamine 2-epimerase (non-hydrolyzing), partial [Candidatus Parcubacteria bacterium]